MSIAAYRPNFVGSNEASRITRWLGATDPAPGKPRHINQLCADLAPAIAAEVEFMRSQTAVARLIARMTGLREFACLTAVKAALATLTPSVGAQQEGVSMQRAA